tara:strand:- start:220 stop:2184 length:1965 start_codon:yes stop_codon:yes gene_type:complete
MVEEVGTKFTGVKISELKAALQKDGKQDNANSKAEQAQNKELIETQKETVGFLQSLVNSSVAGFKFQRDQALQDERAKAISGGDDDVSGGDLGTETFSKSFSGLKKLFGVVGLTIGGILLGVKALQDEFFKGAVKDLIEALKDLGRLLLDFAKAVMPFITTILTYTVQGLTAGIKGIAKVFEYLKDFNDNADIDPEDYKGIPVIGAATILSIKKIKTSFLSATGQIDNVANNLDDTAKKMATNADDIVKTRQPGILARFSRLIRMPFLRLGGIFAIAFKPVRVAIDTFADTFKGIGRTIAGAFRSVAFNVGRVASPLNKLRRTITRIVAPLAKLPVISSVTTFFSKAGGFLKFLGKLFLPFTIIIALVDTVKGFYQGFFGTDLEEGEEPPEGFINKLMAGIEGGIAGLVNSLVGIPLDFLKGAVGWVLGKMGFTGAEEALASFSFKELLDDIISVIFNPIDSALALFKKIFNFDIVGIIRKLPFGSKLLDFFTTDETEQAIKDIKGTRKEEKRVDKFQKEIDEAQAKIDAGIGNEEYLQGLIDKRQAQIDQINAEIGLDNVDALAERISTLQSTADLAEGKEKEKLEERIAELQTRLDEKETIEAGNNQPVVISNNVNDNKQTQINNSGSTVSIQKNTQLTDPALAFLSGGATI